MRTIAILFAVSISLLIGPTTAAPSTAGSGRMATCAAAWKAMSAGQKKATTYKDYSKSCLSGGSGAAAPAATMAAPTATMAASTSGGSSRMATCAAGWKAMSADKKKATTYKDYSKSCLSGGSSAATTAPASTPMATTPTKTAAGAAMGAARGAAPTGATGKCKDGTFTMSKTHSGACSHHGGVDKWL